MSKLFLSAFLLGTLLTGCAGGMLRRCDGQMTDPTVLECAEGLSGKYRMCEPLKDVYQGCVKPE
jgi:hypothetical protein